MPSTLSTHGEQIFERTSLQEKCIFRRDRPATHIQCSAHFKATCTCFPHRMAQSFDSHCTMFSADSALAILHTCAPGELEEALRNRPEMIIRLRNVLDAFPPGPGIGTASHGTASQSSTAPPTATPAPAPQPYAQPCIVPGFGGFVMAAGPPPQPTAEAPTATQGTAESRPVIPIRGRDVPHSTPQPEHRSSTPKSPQAWHMDRASHTWQGEAQHQSRSNWWDRGNWWESWWDRDYHRSASPPAPHSTPRPQRAQHRTGSACFARQRPYARLGNQPYP